MSPEYQRIAIAEACGWKPTLISNLTWRGWAGPSQDPALCATQFDGLPDYLNDLNLMHEAEDVLTGPQRELFGGVLYSGKPCSFQDFCTGRIVFNMSHASAIMRAEAFLKAIGKWE